MPTKDGLLVRLRISSGILAAETANALADLAEGCGNGLFDLSARGNLQMRGIRETMLVTLHDGLLALGLLDATVAAESVRNVVGSPLAGLHKGLDIRPLMSGLETRLAEDTSLHTLPGKFGFLIDDGSWLTLAGVEADIRFDWIGDRFSIGLGGTRTTAARVGMCASGDLVAEAARLAAVFLASREADVHRVRDVVAAIGTLDDDCIVPPVDVNEARDIVGFHELQDGGLTWLGVAAPFGRIDTKMLRGVARVAADTPQKELRLTPFRVILLPSATTPQELHGFITDPDDPRLAVTACVGATGCSRGTTDTRDDAEVLAAVLNPGTGITLHVSGCEKGCAKASATPVTLVARGARYDLVRDGRAGDQPICRHLDLAGAVDAIRAPA